MSDTTLENATQTLGPLTPDESCQITAEDLERPSLLDPSTRRRAFTFVTWPESINHDIFCRLVDGTHLPAACSPLHNADVTEDGELKKEHYHWIIRFPNARYLDSVRSTIGRMIADCSGVIGGDESEQKWYVQPVHDLNSMIRYLCHLDHEDKTRYPINEVRTFGFFDVSPLYASSVADDVHAYAELISACRQNKQLTYHELVNQVLDSQDQTLLRALTRYSYTIKSYLGDRHELVQHSKDGVVM